MYSTILTQDRPKDLAKSEKGGTCIRRKALHRMLQMWSQAPKPTREKSYIQTRATSWDLQPPWVSLCPFFLLSERLFSVFSHEVSVTSINVCHSTTILPLASLSLLLVLHPSFLHSSSDMISSSFLIQIMLSSLPPFFSFLCPPMRLGAGPRAVRLANLTTGGEVIGQGSTNLRLRLKLLSSFWVGP